MDAKKEIEAHRLPCSPMTVVIDGVCRRRLSESYNKLLDRLTHETHPDYVKPEAPKGHEFTPEGEVRSKDFSKQQAKLEKHQPDDPQVLETRKQKLLQEGMMKAEVKKHLKEYEEKLMGNSKMLQDPTGKIKKH